MWLIALKGLSSNGKSTSGRFTISTGNKQATGAKKLRCKMQQICNRSLLTRPLERDPYQGLKFTVQNATDLQQIFMDTHHGPQSLRPHALQPANRPLYADSSPAHQPSRVMHDRRES